MTNLAGKEGSTTVGDLNDERGFLVTSSFERCNGGGGRGNVLAVVKLVDALGIK